MLHTNAMPIFNKLCVLFEDCKMKYFSFIIMKKKKENKNELKCRYLHLKYLQLYRVQSSSICRFNHTVQQVNVRLYGHRKIKTVLQIRVRLFVLSSSLLYLVFLSHDDDIVYYTTQHTLSDELRSQFFFLFFFFFSFHLFHGKSSVTHSNDIFCMVFKFAIDFL